jgi:hypothetical protein
VGLTAFDSTSEPTLGESPKVAQFAAQQEMADLMAQLRLPISDRAIRRARARAEWYSRREFPLDMDDIFRGLSDICALHDLRGAGRRNNLPQPGAREPLERTKRVASHSKSQLQQRLLLADSVAKVR